MKAIVAGCFVPLCAVVLLAQGPPPDGGRFGGPRGLEGPGGFAGRGGLLGAGPGSREVVTNAPYSAVETVSRQQTLVNGNSISTRSQSNVSRDSAGRVRTEETITPPASSGKSAFTVVTIFDPVAGYRYVLDSSSMIARQSPLPKSNRPAPTTSGTPTASARPAARTRPNTASVELSAQSINNENSKGKQVSETIPAGAIGNAQAIQVVRTSWISTDLNVPVQIKTVDPRNGTSEMDLTNIVHSEPNPSLFVVPPGYTVQQGGGRGPGGGGPRGGGRRAPTTGTTAQ
jgi:hypothetical protein